MSAVARSYKAVLDLVPNVLLRPEEKDWVKGMVDYIDVSYTEDVGDLRIKQVQLQEDFTQLLYVLSTRVHQIETEFAPVRKSVEDELATSAKKLTVDQRETFVRAHEDCSRFITLIEQGKLLIKNFELQLAVLRSRHQIVMERSYETRKQESLADHY